MSLKDTDITYHQVCDCREYPDIPGSICTAWIIRQYWLISSASLTNTNLYFKFIFYLHSFYNKFPWTIRGRGGGGEEFQTRKETITLLKINTEINRFSKTLNSEKKCTKLRAEFQKVSRQCKVWNLCHLISTGKTESWTLKWMHIQPFAK